MATILETLCGCGCGTTVRYEPIPPAEQARRGPKRFVQGHQNRGLKHTPEHIAASTHRLSENGRWKGGRNIDKSGYVMVKARWHPNANNTGYVREHRLVMEQVLGRYLRRDELVHHLNHIKTDNRPENLRVLSHVEHQRIERIGNRFPRKSGTWLVCEKCHREFYMSGYYKANPSRWCSWECRYPGKTKNRKIPVLYRSSP